MKKWLLTVLLAAGCAEPVLAATPCCTAGEAAILKDVAWVATQANPPADIKARIGTLITVLKSATPLAWSDPDRGLVLGYVAATSEGVYWLALLKDYAASIGVSIKSVAPSVEPPPVVVVPPAPPPAPLPGALDSASIVRIIKSEIAKLPAQPFNGVVDKLIVRGKLCVVDGVYATDCDYDKSEQVQIRQAKGAAIGFNANLDNTWRQGNEPATGPGYAVFALSPDLGMRVCQNQAWAVSGYKEYIIAKGKGCFGFDSQANFSIQQCPYGQPCAPGQSMVLLRQDNPAAWVWTAWQQNVYACLQSSLGQYAAMDGPRVCSR